MHTTKSVYTVPPHKTRPPPKPVPKAFVPKTLPHWSVFIHNSTFHQPAKWRHVCSTDTYHHTSRVKSNTGNMVRVRTPRRVCYLWPHPWARCGIFSLCDETLLFIHRSHNQGLISADRSNKATLLLTIPRCLLSRLQRISRAQFVKLPFSDRDYTLSVGPRHNRMVQAEAIDTRVIGLPLSFLAWILF